MPVELAERYPRVAIIHDWLTIPGGSEQVVIELLGAAARTPSCSPSVYDPAPWPALHHRAAGPRVAPGPPPGGAHAVPQAAAADGPRPSSRSTSASFDLVVSSQPRLREERAHAAPARCTSATATRRCATRGSRASWPARRLGARRPRLLRRRCSAALRRTDLARRRAGPTSSSPTRARRRAHRSATTAARRSSCTRRSTSTATSRRARRRRDATTTCASAGSCPTSASTSPSPRARALGRPLKVVGDGRGARRACARWPGRTPSSSAASPTPSATELLRERARAAVPRRGGLRDRARRGAGGRPAGHRLRRRRRCATRSSTA